MRYPAAEKLEIIRLVERSHLPVRRILDKLGIPATTFYRWYDRYRAFGEAGLEDRTRGPGRVWNRIPDDVRRQIVDLALDEPELSPRELAVTFTDTKGYFVSEASVYRLLKAHDLITSPAFVVIKAGDEFRDKTTAPNQLWQTDFTDLKVIGWGWFYLSTILDDFSRSIIAWKLCTTMRADDVTDTLKLALEASGCDSAEVVHKPRLLSDNGSSYIAGDLAAWLKEQGMDHVRGAPNHPQRHCQTNWIGPVRPTIEGPQAASWHHSAKAAARSCLKVSRRLRWRSWLKWLWIEAWTEANFCRVLMSLNRAIAPSRLRNG